MGLRVTDKSGDVMLAEKCIDKWFRRRESRDGRIRSSTCLYIEVDSYDKSAIADAEREICSRWFCNKLIVTSTREISNLRRDNSRIPLIKSLVIQFLLSFLLHLDFDSFLPRGKQKR